ncbi:hypothetical protein [Streptomyces sp. DG2A-72]|uniref:hypothetical protein n=1 Tax=Streptomyces sp. DG2A-72 TaxID=3051386 RepID=UPI003464BF00
MLARFLPESLSFLVAKGRSEEAREPAARYDVALPAVKSGKQGAADRWTNLVNLFGGGEWFQTLLHWRPPSADCCSSTASPPGCPP